MQLGIQAPAEPLISLKTRLKNAPAIGAFCVLKKTRMGKPFPLWECSACKSSGVVAMKTFVMLCALAVGGIQLGCMAFDEAAGIVQQSSVAKALKSRS